MNLNDFANLRQIIGALAVVISLLYVANKFGKTLMQKLVEKTMRIDNFIDGTDVHC